MFGMLYGFSILALLGGVYIIVISTRVFDLYLAAAALLAFTIFFCSAVIAQGIAKVAWLLEDDYEEHPKPRSKV